MSNKIAIESLSMDLLRVTNGLHNKSYRTAQIFSNEALKRCEEINTKEVKPYFLKIIKKINDCLSKKPTERTSEDTLMYSVLCKNYARKYLN